MEGIGFGGVQSSAYVFRHAAMHFVASVPGDHLVTAGKKSLLDWFTAKHRQKHELKECAGGHKKANVLNRLDRWTGGSVEYKTDPRHAEKLVQELGLEICKSVIMYSVKAPAEQQSSNELRGRSPTSGRWQLAGTTRR